jgi:hypothetical protein
LLAARKIKGGKTEGDSQRREFNHDIHLCSSTPFSGIIGAVSVAAFSSFFRNWISRLVPHLISYAISTLLSAGLLRMIPRALADLSYIMAALLPLL